MRLNETGILGTQLCSGGPDPTCAVTELCLQPQLAASSACPWSGERRAGVGRGITPGMWGQGHGQQGDNALGRTVGDPGELILAWPTSSVDALQLTLPLTGAVDITSCLPGAVYNICKAQEGTASHLFLLSRLWCLFILQHWFFCVRIKEEEGIAQCCYPNCIIVLYVWEPIKLLAAEVKPRIC